MLDFENLDGFVVDLTTDDLCDEWLENLLCGDENEYNKVIKYSIQGKRDYIINEITSSYDYVFCKGVNVYQIVEETLCSYDDLNDEEEKNRQLRLENAKMKYTLKRIAEETAELSQQWSD